jgi:hypothetical protein
MIYLRLAVRLNRRVRKKGATLAHLPFLRGGYMLVASATKSNHKFTLLTLSARAILRHRDNTTPWAIAHFTTTANEVYPYTFNQTALNVSPKIVLYRIAGIVSLTYT